MESRLHQGDTLTCYCAIISHFRDRILIQRKQTDGPTAPSSAERTERVLKERGEGLLRETEVGGQEAAGDEDQRDPHWGDCVSPVITQQLVLPNQF